MDISVNFGVDVNKKSNDLIITLKIFFGKYDLFNVWSLNLNSIVGNYEDQGGITVDKFRELKL